MREWIIGRNPVYETLKAGRRHIFTLLLAKSAKPKGRLADAIHICKKQNIPIRQVDSRQLDAKGHNHQGVALEVSGYPYATIYDIFENIHKGKENALVLILDTLKDPQNLATLLRTADVTGVHGVILPLRQSASITPAVVRASSGATEHLTIVRQNIAQAIALLKEKDIWIMGLEHTPTAKAPNELSLDIPLALVVGSEAQGMRALTRKSCDLFLRLPMRGHVDSLNASVAGSIALYLAWEKRNFQGKIDPENSTEK